MGKNVKVFKIADAVKGILGQPVKKKKLKKDKALRNLIKQMETRRKDIKTELQEGGLKGEREEMLRQHLEILDKQIKKASSILNQMKP